MILGIFRLSDSLKAGLKRMQSKQSIRKIELEEQRKGF